jgi:predicted neuraminidase
MRVGASLLVVLAGVQSQAIPGLNPDGVIRPTQDGRHVATLPQSYPNHDPTRENGGQEHATFQLHLPNGEILVSWFSGQMEAECEMHVALSRLLPHSSTFLAAETVSARKNYSNQNPVLFLDPETKYLHLYHPSQVVGEGQATSSILGLVSKDGRGLNWTTPNTVFPAGGGAFPRGSVVSSADGSGELLLPMYFTPHGYDPDTSYDYCSIQVSNKDRKASGGKVKWTNHTIAGSQGLAQPSMVRLHNGTLRTFFRDRYCNNIHAATSTDEGRTWTPPAPTVLPNNNCGIYAAALKSGAVVAVFNNAHMGRTPLSIALSYDGGASWPFVRDLEDEPLPKGSNCTCGRGWSPPAVPPQLPDHYHKDCYPTFAYPTVFQSGDGNIHVTYDHNRQVGCARAAVGCQLQMLVVLLGHVCRLPAAFAEGPGDCSGWDTYVAQSRAPPHAS